MIDLDELQLAARNHGMPLELLREPITPAGLHYLLIHFDIPHVDPETWRLEIGGLVRQPLSALARRPPRRARTDAHGHARVRRERPRLIPDHTPSQPWLREAVGTAEWTGTSARSDPRGGRSREPPRDLVFTGLDRGIQGGIEHDYERSLSARRGARRRRPARVRDERRAAAAAARVPSAPHRPRLVRHGAREVAALDHRDRGRVRRLPAGAHVPDHARRRRHGRPFVERMLPRSLLIPPGIPDFLYARPPRRRRTGHAPRPRLVGPSSGRARRGERRRRRDMGRRRARAAARPVRVARLQLRVGRRRRRARALLPRDRRRREHPAARARVELRRLLQQRRAAGPRHRRGRLGHGDD